MYCFKKEEEFKELLENLDIENIEIDLSNKNVKENTGILLEKDKQIDIEIEKLLSEEDEHSNEPQKSQENNESQYI